MKINNEDRTCWFVGATYGREDQFPRFLQDGIWENGYEDKYLDLVKAIKEGDRIAIKSSYTRKHNLPFDNRGHFVSVMAIKAVGIVKENIGDGYKIKVDWTQLESPKEWYFYTHRGTIWRVQPGEWHGDALIGFTFEGKPQDVDQFRNAPYWRERFGDEPTDKLRFQWSRFYSAVADKLLNCRSDRTPLISAIHDIASRVDGLSNLQDQYSNGTSGPLRDICPFTTFGIFNRGIKDSNRKLIAKGLAEFLGVDDPVPDSFEGIPVLNNQRSWFFGFEKDRNPEDIDMLWMIFAEALRYADSDDTDARNEFERAYDNATEICGVGWNLTMGLYWIRPWSFPSLDGQSRRYIDKKLGIHLDRNGPGRRCDSQDYLRVLSILETRFNEEAYPVHSFPDLSMAAWFFKDPGKDLKGSDINLDFTNDENDDGSESELIVAPLEPYSIDDIMNEGCFLDKSEVKRFLERLRTKKNLILQGPPGTGKTWLGKRLALALVTQRDESKIKTVQFHPNLSYEDFIRGWRPSGDGKLTLVDGPFMEMIKAASKSPSDRYVIVIEEINRGNPAQIFGEMLTLLEADKRTPNEALELCYRRYDNEKIFIPDNLFLIGTMNIADRSLALVDFALRRRFAFVDLVPCLGESWKKWLATECGIGHNIIIEIQKRMLALNKEIETDSTLGPQFRIGHSYVTPPLKMKISDAREWFKQVVETEIGPLLEEYWFDSRNDANTMKKKLIEGF